MVDSVEIHAEESIDPSLAQLQKEQQEQENPTEAFEMPEKFKDKSPEDIVKSYLELEKKFSSGERVTEDTPASEDSEGGANPDDAEENKPEDETEDRFAEFTQELQSQGELSEESYSKLESQGYPKEMVDAYIAGQKAIQEKEIHHLETQVFEQAGGKENYENMIKWASGNFSTEEIEAFDKSIIGSDYERRIALNDLKTRFKEANGQPQLLEGKSTGSRVQGFRSMHELSKAQADPRYSSDPHYRQEVEEKLAVSKF